MPFIEARAPHLSGWSVGEHTEHVLLVNQFGLKSALKPEAGRSDLGNHPLQTKFILLVGRIPRGKAKAPERVLPKGIKLNELEALFFQLEQMIELLLPKVKELDASSLRFQHPRLGPLTISEWLRFLELHQNHHLRIIRDILASSAKPQS